MKRVYISGPMTGFPDFNFPAFRDASARLRGLGHCVLNPARNPLGLEYHHYMDIAMAMVRCAEVVVLLPGAETSKGSRAEVAYAVSLGLSVCEMDHFMGAE